MRSAAAGRRAGDDRPARRGVQQDWARRLERAHAQRRLRRDRSAGQHEQLRAGAAARRAARAAGDGAVVEARSQKIDRDLEDFDTKIEWIRLLQPEFDTVHIFQIWNKAYNISVLMASPANKYTTILDAVDYARSVDQEQARRHQHPRVGVAGLREQAGRAGGAGAGVLRRQFREETMTDANRKVAYPDERSFRRLRTGDADPRRRERASAGVHAARPGAAAAAGRGGGVERRVGAAVPGEAYSRSRTACRRGRSVGTTAKRRRWR